MLREVGNSLIDSDIHLPILKFALQLLATQSGVLLSLLTQVSTDARACLLRNADGEPVGLGRLVSARQHLADIAIV